MNKVHKAEYVTFANAFGVLVLKCGRPINDNTVWHVTQVPTCKRCLRILKSRKKRGKKC